MAGESDEPGSAAARLEAALERIAAAAARRDNPPTTRSNAHHGVQFDDQPRARSGVSAHMVEAPAPGMGTPETGTPETGTPEMGTPETGTTGRAVSAIPETESGVAGTGATGMIATRMAAVDMGTPVAVEIMARLDGLIERLRGALAVRPG